MKKLFGLIFSIVLLLSFQIRNSLIAQSCTISAGTLTSSSNFTTCSGDGISDLIVLSSSGATGSNYKILSLDPFGLILGITPSLTLDVEGNIGGFQIAGISYNGTVTNLQVGKNINQLSGCFKLVHLGKTVTVFHVSPGQITTEGGSTDTSVCVSDGKPDVLNLRFTNAYAFGFLFVLTDTNDIVLNSSTSNVNLEGTGAGKAKLWVIGSCLESVEIANGTSVHNLPINQKLSNPINIIKKTGCSTTVCTPELKSCPGKVLMCVNNVSTCVTSKQVSKLLSQGAVMGGCVRCSTTNSALTISGIPSRPINMQELEIYPNPSSGSFVIESLIQLNTKFDLLSLTGQVVWSTTLKSEQARPVKLQVSEINLSPGVIYSSSV